jgi:hypothetical protein
MEFQQDNLGLYQRAVQWEEDGKIKGVNLKLPQDLAKFAGQWMRNIRAQPGLSPPIRLGACSAPGSGKVQAGNRLFFQQLRPRPEPPEPFLHLAEKRHQASSRTWVKVCNQRDISSLPLDRCNLSDYIQFIMNVLPYSP